MDLDLEKKTFSVLEYDKIMIKENTVANKYTPDQWLVVEFINGDQTFRKILAGWWGGYLNGDSWRLSSAITEIVDQGDSYSIHNESGSVYTCYKNNYGLTGLTGGVLSNWQEQARGRDDVTITALEIEQIV